jgi:hypothetical protein
VTYQCSVLARVKGAFLLLARHRQTSATLEATGPKQAALLVSLGPELVLVPFPYHHSTVATILTNVMVMVMAVVAGVAAGVYPWQHLGNTGKQRCLW